MYIRPPFRIVNISQAPEQRFNGFQTALHVITDTTIDTLLFLGNHQ